MIALLLAAGVMLSHHVAWALLGAPTVAGAAQGWPAWFSPGALLLLSLLAAIGLAVGAALCHRGTPGPNLAGDLLSFRIRGH